MKIKSLFPAALAIASISVYSCKEKPRYDAGLTPEESMKTFQLKEGFSIEPYAVEPHVMSPVDMVFDENGGLYIIEMGDYPYQADTINPKGRIKFLKDTDGDGKIDESVIFAEKLPSATSMLPWKGGLIVTAAPEIYYLKDTTGDHKADIKEVLFTGFFDRNSEAQITSLRFGVDNWIYANNNGQAGKVTPGNNPNAEPLSVGGGDFRFRMDNGKYEIESGNGQFGLAIDDWGTRFFTQNTLFIQQAPIPGRYLHRHKNMPSYAGSVKIYEDDLMFQKTPPPYWRATRSARRQHQYDSLGLGRTEWADSHFTGASGGTFYGGDAFPEEYYGSIFTGEVAGNLVHRTVLEEVNGEPQYKATRGKGEEDREFLAATDSWFRPANLAIGPDGNLYLVDMYLQHIETPVSIPDDLKADMDFEAGSDKGRIYRIFPSNGEKRDLKDVNLGSKTTAELVEVLTHKNQWWRLNAQRLILERQDKSVIPALKEMFNTNSDPRTRLHAFYALDGLGAMDAGLALKAMQDSHEGVRNHGLVVSERYSQHLNDILKLTEDASQRVALQATLSAGQFPSDKVNNTLAAVLEKYGSQKLFRTAVLTSIPGSSLTLLNHLNKNGSFLKENEGRNNFLEDLSFIIASRNSKNEITQLLELTATLPADSQLSSLTGLEKGLKKSGIKGNAVNAATLKALATIEQNGSQEVKDEISKIKTTIAE